MSNSRNRIAKLEARTSSGIDYRPMLVEILAKKDALWWPTRADPKHNFAEVLKLQKQDRLGKYGIQARAAGRHDWTTAMEVRNTLVAAGLCKAKRSKGGEVSALILTDQGEADARALCGLETLETPITRVLFQYAQLRKATSRAGIAEQLLFCRPLYGDSGQWSHLTAAVLPLVVAGAMSWTFDTVGRVYYSLEADEITPLAYSDETHDEDLEALYSDVFEQEVMRLDALEPTNDLFIPLPRGESIGIHEFYPDSHDPDFEAKREHIEKLEQAISRYGAFELDTTSTQGVDE